MWNFSHPTRFEIILWFQNQIGHFKRLSKQKINFVTKIQSNLIYCESSKTKWCSSAKYVHQSIVLVRKAPIHKFACKNSWMLQQNVLKVKENGISLLYEFRFFWLSSFRFNLSILFENLLWRGSAHLVQYGNISFAMGISENKSSCSTWDQ